MTRRLYVDCETYSTVDLRQRGLDAYLACPQWHLLLVGWCIDDGDVVVSDPADGPLPAALIAALGDHAVHKYAHYAAFDRLSLVTHGLEVSAPIHWRCTSSRARQLGLPSSLDAVGVALGLAADTAKQRGAGPLLHLFCRPQANGQPADRRLSAPEWRRFRDYCAQDVTALRTIAQSLPWTGWDADLYAADAAINARGVALDVSAAEEALRERDRLVTAATRELVVATDNRVGVPTQLAAIAAELAREGVSGLPDLTTATCRRRLAAGGLTATARQLLTVRVATAPATAVTKAQAMLDYVGPDDRLRHMLRLDGAARTGRWSGAGPQLQNLPRPNDEAGLAGLAGRLRALLVAAPGHELLRADWSNVEGRVLAWLAGEQWKLAAFRAQDTGDRRDAYIRLYAALVDVPPDTVRADERQIGKIFELALGFGGSVGALANALRDADRSADDVGASLLSRATPAERQAGADAWLRSREPARVGLTELTWQGLWVAVQRYREQNRAIAGWWWSCERAARSAVTRRAHTTAGRVAFIGGRAPLGVCGPSLAIRLPSGRELRYHGVTVTQTDDRDRGSLTVREVGSRGGWHERTLRGPQIAQNVTQAVACDLLREALVQLHYAGWRVVLHVHDDIVAEHRVGERDIAELLWIMEQAPAWADGLPLRAEGSTGGHYG